MQGFLMSCCPWIRIVETARKYNSGKVRFNLAAIRNSREIRNRATVTTSEIITVIGIGQSPLSFTQSVTEQKKYNKCAIWRCIVLEVKLTRKSGITRKQSFSDCP